MKSTITIIAAILSCLMFIPFARIFLTTDIMDDTQILTILPPLETSKHGAFHGKDLILYTDNQTKVNYNE